jgi:hypothetical protein
LWVVLFTALLWFGSVLVTWLNLRKVKTPRSFKEVLRDSILGGVFSAAAIGLIVIASYSYFLVYTVYQDHQSLVNHIAKLNELKSELASALEVRKHSMITGDPVLGNTISLLMAFDMFRHAQNGKPCVLMLTMPSSDNNNPMPSMIAQLSNPVSDCFTFGPMDSRMNPDEEKRALDGMVPAEIVFHAAREDKAADQLFNSLGSMVPLKRSYDLPSAAERTHIYMIPKAGQESLIWLQFGTNVRWNGQRAN